MKAEGKKQNAGFGVYDRGQGTGALWRLIVLVLVMVAYCFP
jgi:hypothetical protein